MALQLLQMLREGRNQSDRIQLAREQMNNELRMGSERDQMMQDLKLQELSQQKRQYLDEQKRFDKKYQFDTTQAQIEAQREREKFNQARTLSEADRAQKMELFKLRQTATQQQQATKSQAMMGPQILDYLQKTMMMPPGAERDALLANLEQITGKTYQRPVDQFQQLVNPKK